MTSSLIRRARVVLNNPLEPPLIQSGMLTYFGLWAGLRRQLIEAARLRGYRPDPWLSNAKNRHSGQRCFVLATGPSLNQVDLGLLEGEVTIGVNGAIRAGELPLTYYVTISNWYWKNHIREIQSVECERRFIPCDLDQLDGSGISPTSWIRVQRPQYFGWFGSHLPVPYGFSLAADRTVVLGGSVLFAVLQIVLHLGFSEVIILGVDHNFGPAAEKTARQHGGGWIDGSSSAPVHFSKDYNPPSAAYHLDITAMERGFLCARQEFEKSGRVILNASPGSRLKVFQHTHFDGLFKG